MHGFPLGINYFASADGTSTDLHTPKTPGKDEEQLSGLKRKLQPKHNEGLGRGKVCRVPGGTTGWGPGGYRNRLDQQFYCYLLTHMPEPQASEKAASM